jgi:hypothetical protein
MANALSENDLLWSALVLKTTLHDQYPKKRHVLAKEHAGYC